MCQLAGRVKLPPFPNLVLLEVKFRGRKASWENSSNNPEPVYVFLSASLVLLEVKFEGRRQSSEKNSNNLEPVNVYLSASLNLYAFAGLLWLTATGTHVFAGKGCLAKRQPKCICLLGCDCRGRQHPPVGAKRSQCVSWQAG
jgi:hypothetical protein